MTRREALDHFTLNMVVVEETSWVAVDQFGRQRGRSSEVSFYQGRHKIPLTTEEFLRTINAESYLDEYQSMRNRRRNWYITSAVMAGGALVFMTAALFMAGRDGRVAEAVTLPLMMGGLVAGGLFWLPCTIGMMTNVDPISPHEARRLGEEYNLELLHDLGLERDDMHDDADEEKAPGGLRVDLFFSGESGGIVLGFRF